MHEKIKAPGVTVQEKGSLDLWSQTYLQLLEFGELFIEQ